MKKLKNNNVNYFFDIKGHYDIPNTYTVWDIETTGFSFKDNKIIELGLANVVDGKIIEMKSWILNHDVEIPPIITEITGITKEIIDKEGQDPKKCVEEFLGSFLKKKHHLTHNGMRFDIPFFVEQAAQLFDGGDKYREGMLPRFYRNALDTAVIMKAIKLNMTPIAEEPYKDFADRVMNVRAKGVKYSIDACCEEFEIDKSKVEQHRALGDVVLTHQIYQKLIKLSEKNDIKGTS